MVRQVGNPLIKNPGNASGKRNFIVRKLPFKGGMGVVDYRNAGQTAYREGDHRSFEMVGMDNVDIMFTDNPEETEEKQRIEKEQFQQGRARLQPVIRKRRNTVNENVSRVRTGAEMIGDDMNLMPQIREGSGHFQNAAWSAAVGWKRASRNHGYFKRFSSSAFRRRQNGTSFSKIC